MEKLRLYARSVPITFESWIISFAAIVLIRTLFEQFPNFQLGHYVLIDLPTIVHYGASYLAIIVTLMIILLFFGKTNIQEVSVIGIFGFLVIWIAPVIDFMAGGVGGYLISYFFIPAMELLWRFATFFGGNIDFGITLGIQIETVLGILFCFFYVYTATKKVSRSLLAAFAFYCLIFSIFALPSLIALFLPGGESPMPALVDSIASSHIVPNNMHPNSSLNNTGLVDLAFNKTMFGVNTIIAIVASMLFFFLGTRKKFIALIKNSRPERIFHFFLLFALGTALGYQTWFTSWIDIQSYVLAFTSFIAAWMFSVCQNDIHDENIDAISNPDRPLVAKELSRGDLEAASGIFLLFTFLCAYAASHYTVFFVFMFLFVYFIYSNPPLRLKRFVILNSFLVSLACLSVIMAGFFLVSPDKTIVAFPAGFLIAIIIFFTAVSNIRDIKDAEGDRAAGIKTLPVLLGVGRSKKIIAGVIIFFFILIPWYFRASFLFVPSLVASLLTWYFINQKDYKEWKGFAVYMAYLIFIIAVIFSK